MKYNAPYVDKCQGWYEKRKDPSRNGTSSGFAGDRSLLVVQTQIFLFYPFASISLKYDAPFFDTRRGMSEKRKDPSLAARQPTSRLRMNA